MEDILKWFLIIFFGLFVVWVLMGGPQRAEEKNISPIIRGPGNVGPQPSGSGASGQPNFGN